MDTQRIVFFALLLLFSYLCVVVKEHADFPFPEPFQPEPFLFGKLCLHQMNAGLPSRSPHTNPARLRALRYAAAASRHRSALGEGW
jgi:hypothetical protein